MPTTEELRRQDFKRTVPLAIQGLEVFMLFACPACGRWTIHAPRLNRKGYWYIDHKRVEVHQVRDNGRKKFVGLAPAESCFVDDNRAIKDIERTRTVIRVK